MVSSPASEGRVSNMESVCLGWLASRVLVILTLLDLVLAVTNDITQVRYQEKPFKSSSRLYNHTVSCDSTAITDAKFPYETWACHNIRIDGKKLRHIFLYHESHCGDQGSKKHLDEFDGRNDIAALCRAMMREHGSYKELWTAFIHKPECGTKRETRMILVPTDDPEAPYHWVQTEARGYATTIRCMAVAPKS